MLLMIAAIVATVFVINAIMPAVQRTSSDIVAASDVVGDRLRSDVRIIEATGQASDDTVQVWVKNTGASTIPQIEKMDVFFGETDDFGRVSYDAAATCPFPSPPPRTEPCWQYEIENDTEWAPYSTVRITIYLDYNLSASVDYVTTIVLPNGITTSKVFAL
jgi:hypothetical protein